MSIKFDMTPVNLNGKLRNRIFARSDEDVVHVDTVDLADAREWKKFVEDVCERAKARNILLDAGKCEQMLLNQAAQCADGLNAPGATPESTPKDHKAVLEAFGVEVLGEQEDQSIVAWCTHTRKRFLIKNPGRWNAQEMRQTLGKHGDELLWTAPDAPPEGKYSPADLQRAVALAASEVPRLDASQLIGQGIWKRDEKLLLVTGAQAFVFEDGKFQRVTRPRFGGEIVDFDSGKAWCQKSVRPAARDMTPGKARKHRKKLEDLLKQWNWTHEWDHRITALLVIATFIQACWTWRPLVSILGPSDCGKSTLFAEILKVVFGDWTITGDRSTEAGLRQTIGHDAAPVLVDEFDEYEHRQRVMQLFRTASRGGKILRGTANQEGRMFGVRHIGWFAAIESGDLWGQDRNRFIRLELDDPVERGNVTLPTRSELASLGQQLLAVALWAASAAIPLADRIRSTRIQGVNGRLVESFSVVAALDAVIRHGHDVPDLEAVKALSAFLKGRTSLEDQGEPDQFRLLHDILSAAIRVQEDGRYAERTVGQALKCPERHADDLTAKGIRVVSRKGGGTSLWMVHDMVRERLLKGTRWSDSRIDQILMRLDGAERVQQWCGAVRPYGIAVPWPDCLEFQPGGDGK